jgi:sarcosine oxidase
MSVDTDVAVVGLGAMGSMTLWRLAERGVAAVGFDRFEPPHELGSSHGESRIIRTAYAEGAFYVPLLQAAFALWRELERAGNAELLTVTGALMIGPADGEIVSGTLASARAHGLEHRVFEREEAAARYPQHVLEYGDAVVWDAQAGLLRPELCIAAALDAAQARGATVNRSTAVLSLDAGDDAVSLHLADGSSLRAGHCVVAAGAWTGALIPSLAQRLAVERQVLAWFELDDPSAFEPQRFPVFVRELAGGRIRYGLPSLDDETIKLAVHHEGRRAYPDSLDRSVTPSDLAPLQEFAARRLRGVWSRCRRSVVCMYTNTPDEHFLLGSPPGQERITVAGGCSGHSFKFASVFGDIAADLATTGRTRRDISAFRLDR